MSRPARVCSAPCAAQCLTPAPPRPRSSLSDLKLLPNLACRREVLRYCDRDQGLTEEEHANLLRHAEGKWDAAYLVPLLKAAAELEGPAHGGLRRCPQPIAQFLDTVVRDFPAFGCYMSYPLVDTGDRAGPSALDRLIESAARGDAWLPGAVIEPTRLHFPPLSKLCSAPLPPELRGRGSWWGVLGHSLHQLLSKLRACAPKLTTTAPEPEPLAPHEDDEDTWAPMLEAQVRGGGGRVAAGGLGVECWRWVLSAGAGC